MILPCTEPCYPSEKLEVEITVKVAVSILTVILCMRKKPHFTHLFVNMRLWLAVMLMAANGPSPVNDTVDDIFASLEKKKKRHTCVFLDI